MQIGKLNMYYEVHGRGLPLLVLHGGGSTIQTTYGAILPDLARSRTVIAPEQQGHGHTADVDRPLTYRQMADDTAALLRQLGYRKVDVIGFSNGGGVAMELAMRYPELVRKLVIGSAYHAGTPSIRSFCSHSGRSRPRTCRKCIGRLTWRLRLIRGISLN